MKLSIATAAFYYLPFPEALEIIARAGFHQIEANPHWKGGEWHMAQHLEGIPAAEALRMIREAGLDVATVHDLGGMIEAGRDSVIDAGTHYLMAHLSPPPHYLVLHPPYTKTTDGAAWWAAYEPRYAEDLKAHSTSCSVAVENLLPLPGYHVPLSAFADLFAFAERHDVYINFDTTHCAESGGDICTAAETLGPRIRCIHLGDFADGRSTSRSARAFWISRASSTSSRTSNRSTLTRSS